MSVDRVQIDLGARIDLRLGHWNFWPERESGAVRKAARRRLWGAAMTLDQGGRLFPMLRRVFRVCSRSRRRSLPVGPCVGHGLEAWRLGGKRNAIHPVGRRLA